MKNSIISSIRATGAIPSSLSRRSRKTLFAVIFIIIVVVGVAIYLAMQSSDTNTPVTPTPTPSSSVTPTPSPTPTSSVTGIDIAEASSLQYTVTVTEAGVSQGSYTYYGKNTGTANFMMRMELTDDVGDLSIIVLNGVEKKAWSYSDGEWIDVSVGYDSQFDVYNTMWQGSADSLAGWSGIGDWDYSVGNSGVRISGVVVNPVLSDSLFQPSL